MYFQYLFIRYNMYWNINLLVVNYRLINDPETVHLHTIIMTDFSSQKSKNLSIKY